MTRVARIVEKKRPPKSFGQTCSNHLSLSRNLIFSFINKRVVLVPIVFLIGYYILQIAYQLDFGLLGMLCPNELWNEDECSPKDGSMSLFGSNNTLQPNPEMLTKCCRKWVKVKYAEWEKRMAALTNLLTFLFGFYMSQIMSTWWSTVSSIPDLESFLLTFAGLVSDRNPNFTLSKIEGKTKVGNKSNFPRVVLEVQKMVARYGLLAWALCFNNISRDFHKKFKTTQQLKEKGLLKDREISELKVREVIWNK